MSVVVDISDYQGASPPLKMLRDQHAVSGVIIQYNDGTGHTNPYARAQHAAAVSLGMQVSAYLFCEVSEPPSAQIQKTLDVADSLGGLDAGAHVFMDTEGSGGFSADGAAEAFLLAGRDYIRAHAPKWVAGAYGSDSYWRGLNVARTGWNGLDIWTADYGVARPGVSPYYGWQFTDSFAGAFDASIFPSGIIRLPQPEPADVGQMNHARWVLLANFLHSHYAPANWGPDWRAWTSDPALAYQILAEHHLV